MPASILDITTQPRLTPSYTFLRETVKTNSNIQGGNSLQQLTGLGALSLASNLGIPQVGQFAQSAIESSGNFTPLGQYSTTPYVNLHRIPGIEYADFRARKGFKSTDLLGKRIDGLAASTDNVTGIDSLKSKWISVAYAAASATPGGAYSVFNRNANKYFGAGWGDHGNIYALRNDFTARSHITTKWDKNTKSWEPTKNKLSKATPFRGDRVQVIDFRKERTIEEAYVWNPITLNFNLGDFSNDTLNALGSDVLNQTQDFIKFYLTGPKLAPGNKTAKDDIIVFRAAITSLTDSFNPSWTPIKYIGRSDTNYQYDSYSRAIQLAFEVYATDRDEMKPIWRKLNALAGYTAPTYNRDSIALEGPWMRITIGDLFYQQPVVITSLTYTLHDNDTTWEINIEQDESMMQVPKHVSVTMGLNIITNELPQKGGRFYTLAKQFNEQGRALPGNDNWISDAFTTGREPLVIPLVDELENESGFDE